MLSTPGESPLAALPARWRLGGVYAALLGLIACLCAMVVLSPASGARSLALLDYGTWALLVLLAVLGVLLGAGPLAVRIRRRGDAAPARPPWPLALTLPLLVTTFATPFAAPALWSAPHGHVMAALVAAAASGWLIVRIVNRLRSATWTREDFQAMWLASTRPAAARRIARIHRALASGLAGRYLMPRARLRAPGDRDMHLTVELGPLTADLYDGLVHLTVRRGRIPVRALERLRQSSLLTVEALRAPGTLAVVSLRGEPWQLEELGRAAASLIAAHELRSVHAPAAAILEEEEDGGFERTLGACLTVPLITSNGARLVVTLGEERLVGLAPGRRQRPVAVDLRRRFVLHLAHTPGRPGEPPTLGITVRQRLDDGAAGVRGAATAGWAELRLQVPLADFDPALAARLPAQAVDAPRLAHPARDFGPLWRGLRAAALEQGLSVPTLAGVEPGPDPQPEPQLVMERVSQAHWQIPRGRAWRLVPAGCALGVVSITLIALAEMARHVIVFPFWEHSGWTPVLVMLAPVAALIAALGLGRASFAQYLRAASVEGLDLLAHGFGLDAWRARIGSSPARGALTGSRRGPERVRIELERGLVATLRVWCAGERAAGPCMAEQLELRTLAGAPQAYRDWLLVMHRRIQGLDGQSLLEEHGAERVLTLETRRAPGSGEGAWAALRGLVAPGLHGPLPHMRVAALDADAEHRAALVIALGRLLPPTVPLPSGIAHVVDRGRRPVLRRSAAIAAVACSVLAMPRIDPQAWPVAPAGPEPVLLSACPQAADDEPYAALEEARCVHNAAGSVAPLTARDVDDTAPRLAADDRRARAFALALWERSRTAHHP